MAIAEHGGAVAQVGLKQSSLDLPFSVKAERKLSHKDVMAMMRDHYEGTEFDMTQGMLAGPFGSPFRVEGAAKGAQVPRGISIMRSIYSTISQTGPDGSLVWFAPDTAETSVYMPLDSRSSALSQSMFTGTYKNFTRESSFWAFDFVANWMQLNFKGMNEEDVKPRQQAWQDTIDKERAELLERKASVDEISRWQVRIQERVLSDWWSLAQGLIVKWNDLEKTTDATSGAKWAYPQDWANMVGMTNDIHPVYVQPAAAPLTPMSGYVPSKVALPSQWDAGKRQWGHYDEPPPASVLAAVVPTTEYGSVQVAAFGVLLFVAGSLSGFVMGRRQPVKGGVAYEPLAAY